MAFVMIKREGKPFPMNKELDTTANPFVEERNEESLEDSVNENDMFLFPVWVTKELDSNSKSI